jgi:parallel beta-helix repeat protein
MFGGSSRNTVKENLANGNGGNGIQLFDAFENEIAENEASGNPFGIALVFASDNTVSENQANDNLVFGIALGFSSNNNQIIENVALNNLECDIFNLSSNVGNVFVENEAGCTSGF